MTIHPQTPRPPFAPVDDTPRPPTCCAPTNTPPTWDDATFSTIHTPYYCYS